MKPLFLLPFLLPLFTPLSATPATEAVPTDLQRMADRLRYELKRESDQRKAQFYTHPQMPGAKPGEAQPAAYLPAAPQHTAPQRAMADQPAYKERLDSIVSLQDTKQLFTYDDRGNILTHELLKWDTLAWLPQSREVTTYNDDNLVTSIISYAYADTDYVPITAVYQGYYDPARNQIITGSATWDAEHHDWRFRGGVAISEVDEQGREVSYTLYLGWDDDSWQPSDPYEHYDVDYLDDDVIQTTWYEVRFSEPVPLRRRHVRNDLQHRYTMMYENFTYHDGQWISTEFNEEHRWFYGDNIWEYRTTYHEYRVSYSLNGLYDYGYKSASEYDEHHTEVMSEYYNWNSATQRWKGSHHSEDVYRYYPSEWGDVAMVLRSVSLDDWNDNYNTWSWGHLIEHDYDENCEWTYNAQATWSAEANDWIYSYKEKIDRQYDEQGRIVSQEQVAWDTDTQQWQHPFYHTDYTYADDGTVTQTQYEQWDNDQQQWQEGWLILTRKDDHGSIVYEDYSRWDASQQRFIPTHIKESGFIYDEGCSEGFMFDGVAEVFTLELENWDEESGTWSYGRKIQHEFDESYRLVRRLTSYWIPEVQDFFLAEDLQQEFDETGQMIEYQLDTYSEDGNPYFSYHEKWSKRYDAHSNVIESRTYDYDFTRGEFWMTTRQAYAYDLDTMAPDVMGLTSLGYYNDKPLSYEYQEFNPSGAETRHEERYFYYSAVDAGTEGFTQPVAPATLDVVDGTLTFSSPSPTSLTICTLDGKHVASHSQVRTFSLHLPSGTYVVTVNGHASVLRIKN